jgi:O-antigen/teichoic acid export membrane protein
LTSQGKSLRESAQQALLWSGGVSLFRDLLQFGQMLILARLLDPVIYGTAGLATTIINFLGLASFQHVITHVLQSRDPTKVNFSEHFTAGLVLNCALFALANLLALYLRSGEHAQLSPLIHLLSLTYLLSVPAELRTKMLELNHDWLRLRNLQFSAIIVSVGTGIGMALAGAGVYALVVPGLLGSSVFVADLLLIAKWRPKWQWQYSSYRETLRFGFQRAGSNALNGGRSLVQNALITQYTQYAGLGIFNRADGLANMFCGRVAQEVGNAIYPVITRADAQSERFQRISALVLRAVAWVVIPIAVFLSLEAEPIVGLVYGPKWLSVVPLLPLVLAMTAIGSIGATTYRLLLANDQTRMCLTSDLFAFSIAVPVMLLLVPVGLIAYLWGALAVSAVIAFLLVSMLVASAGVTVNGVLVSLVPALTGAAGAMLISQQFAALLPAVLPVFVRIMIVGVAFAATYVAVLRLLFGSALRDVLDYVPGAVAIRSKLFPVNRQ